jgi:hypothetical protein
MLIGDTDTGDQLLSDEEINYMISVHGTLSRAAAESARAIAAKYARNMSRSIGGLSADFAAKYRQYMELAQSLSVNDEVHPVSPFLSGYRRGEKESVELDSDRESTFSRKGVHDNNRVYPSDDYGSYDYRRV